MRDTADLPRAKSMCSLLHVGYKQSRDRRTGARLCRPIRFLCVWHTEIQRQTIVVRYRRKRSTIAVYLWRNQPSVMRFRLVRRVYNTVTCRILIFGAPRINGASFGLQTDGRLFRDGPNILVGKTSFARTFVTMTLVPCELCQTLTDIRRPGSAVDFHVVWLTESIPRMHVTLPRRRVILSKAASMLRKRNRGVRHAPVFSPTIEQFASVVVDEFVIPSNVIRRNFCCRGTAFGVRATFVNDLHTQ